MKTLYLMQGIPGSGKSTIAKALAKSLSTHCVICSTDDLWWVNGRYKFQPEIAHLKHADNRERVRTLMELGVANIIVDNTNTKREYAAPYVEMAREYGYAVQVIRIEVDLTTALARNAERREDRRVPDETIVSMWNDMRSSISDLGSLLAVE